jgi:hypothetical protein
MICDFYRHGLPDKLGITYNSGNLKSHIINQKLLVLDPEN